MAAEQDETERVTVKTYVPAYQREIWDESADELDMSRSEFVRSMVQAGRRGFDPRGDGPETTEDDDMQSGETDHSQHDADGVGLGADPDAFDSLVLDLLDDRCLSDDDLLEELTGDIEERLYDAIDRLQEANEIKYSGRDGGYVRIE